MEDGRIPRTCFTANSPPTPDALQASLSGSRMSANVTRKLATLKPGIKLCREVSDRGIRLVHEERSQETAQKCVTVTITLELGCTATPGAVITTLGETSQSASTLSFKTALQS